MRAPTFNKDRKVLALNF
uniref:Uncharacterized protein n=1 Tax=Arundo donax TaxID=35708 RepID=A0A0A9GTW7_ARUDO